MRSIAFLLVVVSTAHADEPASVDLREWLKARGASESSLADWQQGSCFEVGVGPDHETALQCYEQEFATRKIRGDSEPGGIGRLQELWLSPVSDGNDEADRVRAALDHDLRERICKARGRYVWSKRRFRRKP